jgi:hypothetical protein
MSFCEHCQGQRFDRAQVLRALRAARKRLSGSRENRLVEQGLALAIETVRALDIPHLDEPEEVLEGEIVH